MANIREIAREIELGIFGRDIRLAEYRKTLCALADTFNSKTQIIQFAWSIHTGQGNESIENLTPQEQRAAQTLYEQGLIVPTQNYETDGDETIMDVEHFDHVSWALDMNGNVVITKLSEQGDEIIELSPIQQHAVTSLNYKLQNDEAWKTTPIILQDRREVEPITTDRQAHLRDLRSHEASTLPPRLV